MHEFPTGWTTKTNLIKGIIINFLKEIYFDYEKLIKINV